MGNSRVERRGGHCVPLLQKVGAEGLIPQAGHRTGMGSRSLGQEQRESNTASRLHSP